MKCLCSLSLLVNTLQVSQRNKQREGALGSLGNAADFTTVDGEEKSLDEA